MTDPNLELEFLKFQTVADTVYQLVNQKYEALQAILQKAERRIKIESSKQTQSSASAAVSLVYAGTDKYCSYNAPD